MAKHKNTKAAAILEMMNKGMSNKEIRTRMKVSPGYLWKLRNQMVHKVEDTEDVKEALYQVTRGRQARQKGAPKPNGSDIINEMAQDAMDALLEKRAEQYGSFMFSANVAIRLKSVMHNAIAQKDVHLAPDQMLALDMIAVKISRILTGNPSHLDSWVDIAGYAKLVADRLQGTVR